MTTDLPIEEEAGLDGPTRREPRLGRALKRVRTPGAETAARDDGAPAKSKRRAIRRRRRGWRSPLTRQVLMINVLVLVIPILGLLHLDQFRQSLIESELDALRTQGRAFALSLGSTAVSAPQVGEERLESEPARRLLRVLLVETGIRGRVFARDGKLIADSFVLLGPGGEVQVIELPPPDNGSPMVRLDRLYNWAINWLPGPSDLPLYQEFVEQRAQDYREVERALAGESAVAVRSEEGERLVLSAAVPIQRYRKVQGALMLSKGGADINAAVYGRRLDIIVVFAVALAVTVLLSFYLAGTLARPIRRLAEAADLVRYGKGRHYRIPDFTRRDDEIGDLSGALREMTEALWVRLDAIEGFAADVAHEIKNPLTSLRSAVETVARVEDPEQQKKLMTIILDDVQRLDRLISDISDASRLDAELSRGESETVDLGRLLDALVETQRATAPEDGPRFELSVPPHQDLTVSGIEGRLGQVFRNLINNAISFSPPGGAIRLAASREKSWLVITISDQGPGLPEDRVEAIFDRFYSERPRGEKFGTHSGLGLSISRQIVEAHGGTIRAENRRDDQGRIAGASFTVSLPAE
jgi:two-component system sensor histidine kinase ChvG